MNSESLNLRKNVSKVGVDWELFLGKHRQGRQRDRDALDCDSLQLFGPNSGWSLMGAEEQDRLWSDFPANFVFKTSGSTGSAQSWLRTKKKKIAAELTIICDLLRDRRVGCVLNFVPMRHLHGLLLGFGLPMRLGVSVVNGALGEAAALIMRLGQDPLIMAVSSAIEALRRCLMPLQQLSGVTLFHSSARLQGEAAKFPGLLPGGCMLEILGSTETGLMVSRWRSGIAAPPWRFVPDLRGVAPTLAGEEGELFLSGPRLARPAGSLACVAWQSGDLIRLMDEDRFEHVGRVSDVVKINGRRIHLEPLEGQLRPFLKGTEFAIAMCNDEVRGERFDLIFHADTSSTTKIEAIWHAITEILPADLRPKRVRPVSTILRSTLGKSLNQ